LIALDSPRWKEIRHAYGPAGDIPGLLRAIDSDESDAKKGESCWQEVWSSLCHQYSIYPATYAAIPHMVAVAERGSLRNQLEILIFIGTVCAFGKLDSGPVPADFIEPFDTAMSKMKGISMRIVRDAVDHDMLDRYPLPYLIQALLVLRFGAGPVICYLDKFVGGDFDVDIECQECESGDYVNLERLDSSPDTDRALAKDLEDGLLLIRETPEDQWSSEYVVQIAAALASTLGDESLSSIILGFRSQVECSTCGHRFRISDGMEI